jgi:hypothetical protein
MPHNLTKIQFPEQEDISKIKRLYDPLSIDSSTISFWNQRVAMYCAIKGTLSVSYCDLEHDFLIEGHYPESLAVCLYRGVLKDGIDRETAVLQQSTILDHTMAGARSAINFTKSLFYIINGETKIDSCNREYADATTFFKKDGKFICITLLDAICEYILDYARSRSQEESHERMCIITGSLPSELSGMEHLSMTGYLESISRSTTPTNTEEINNLKNMIPSILKRLNFEDKSLLWKYMEINNQLKVLNGREGRRWIQFIPNADEEAEGEAEADTDEQIENKDVTKIENMILIRQKEINIENLNKSIDKQHEIMKYNKPLIKNNHISDNYYKNARKAYDEKIIFKNKLEKEISFLEKIKDINNALEDAIKNNEMIDAIIKNSQAIAREQAKFDINKLEKLTDDVSEQIDRQEEHNEALSIAMDTIYTTTNDVMTDDDFIAAMEEFHIESDSEVTPTPTSVSMPSVPLNTEINRDRVVEREIISVPH